MKVIKIIVKINVEIRLEVLTMMTVNIIKITSLLSKTQQGRVHLTSKLFKDSWQAQT
jgi:hypothetical protein